MREALSVAGHCRRETKASPAHSCHEHYRFTASNLWCGALGNMKLPSMTSPWAVCVVLLLATLLNYMDRQTLAVTLPTLKQEYNLAEGRVGIVEGSFGFAFAAGSILFGWMADRIGPRRLYPIVLTGWSLAGIVTAGASQPWIVSWFETTGDSQGTGAFRWIPLCRTAL